MVAENPDLKGRGEQLRRLINANERSELYEEIDRLRKLLHECWPCVYDAVYGRYPNKRSLLEKMDEFRELTGD